MIPSYTVGLAEGTVLGVVATIAWLIAAGAPPPIRRKRGKRS